MNVEVVMNRRLTAFHFYWILDCENSDKTEKMLCPKQYFKKSSISTKV